jgi:hypothetical protein
MSTQDSKKREIAYVMRDAIFEEPFEVFASANGWWVDGTKLERLIGGLKCYLTLKQALISAGISERQYRYFLEQHPKFCQVKERCREVLPILAKSTIHKEIGKNWHAAAWFLERVESEEYARKPTKEERATEQNSVLREVEEAFFNGDGELSLNDKMKKYYESRVKDDKPK